MDRIRMPLSKSKEVTITFRDAFREFVVDATARGLSPKTIRNYELHFHSVSRHMDVDVPLGKLNRNMINEMVVAMRESGLAHNSISSYARVVGTFLQWCDKLGYCHVEMPTYRQQETIKETYTDEELKRLLTPPDKTCRFSTYRTWVIINFLLNSGCRASTVRNILNSDVDLVQQQVFFRHTFARKYLIDCGGDAFTLQKILGHSTLKMTKHYCNIFDADVARNFDNFSPLAFMTRQEEQKRIKR